MKSINFMLVFIMIVAQSIYGQGSGENRIEKLLRDIGYTFEKGDEGIYYVTLEFEDSRTQLIRIAPFNSSLTNKKEIDIWSPVAAYTSTIPDSIAHRMFIESAETEAGRFQSYKEENGYLLVFSAIFYGKYDQNVLKTIINEVGAVSDIFEFELTQKDDY